ncbi:MAG TPA: glycosyltransferase 87 family protein [Gaiellaceae bacterium]|nr:glycosyltransferase 87 family protein [Gaiellaceae bacterium]
MPCGWPFVIAIAAALLVLRVRDVRCYFLALTCLPVVSGLIWGNVVLLLTPFVALAWRWRDNALRAGSVIGVVIAAEPVLWPLMFWPIATRRYKTCGFGLLVALGALLLPWAVIDFDGLASYPELLRAANEVYATHSDSIATMASAIGADAWKSTFAAIAIGLVLGSGALLAGRAGRDEVAFAFAASAAILGTPIVWEYSYSLILGPLAMLQPVFGVSWALLAVFVVAQRLPAPALDAKDLEPGGVACCPPEGIPLVSWYANHAPPSLWPALAYAVATALILGTAARSHLRAVLALRRDYARDAT